MKRFTDWRNDITSCHALTLVREVMAERRLAPELSYRSFCLVKGLEYNQAGTRISFNGETC